MMNTKMLAVIFFLGGSIISVFLLLLIRCYIWGKMILYYFHNLRKAVTLFLKGRDNGYFDQ